MSNVASFRLISSEWVIGEVVETLETQDFITIKKPRVIHIVQNPRDPQSYMPVLLPLDPTSPDETFQLYRHAIAGRSVKMDERMVDKYLSETSSIEIVSSLGALERSA